MTDCYPPSGRDEWSLANVTEQLCSCSFSQDDTLIDVMKKYQNYIIQREKGDSISASMGIPERDIKKLVICQLNNHGFSCILFASSVYDEQFFWSVTKTYKMVCHCKDCNGFTI